jgi:hypothetical protein
LRRRLEVGVLRVERHVPTEVRVRMVEFIATGDEP